MAGASLGVLALLRPLAGGDLAPPATTLLLMAATATGLEQLSRYGIDNLSVPLATGLLWARFTP